MLSTPCCSCVYDRPFPYFCILLLLPVFHGKIDADAFHEDKLHTLLYDMVTEIGADMLNVDESELVICSATTLASLFFPSSV